MQKKHAKLREYFAKNITYLQIHKLHLLTALSCVISLLFLGCFVMLNLGSTLIADDYIFYEFLDTTPLFDAFQNYHILTGRYSNAALLIMSIKLFGIQALWIIPLASLLILYAGVGLAVNELSRLIQPKATPNIVHISTVALASLIVTLSLIASPSIYDVYVWFSAASVYISSAAITSLAIFVALRSLRHKKISAINCGVFFLLCLISAGFYELIPISFVSIGTTLLAVSFTKYVKIRFKSPMRIYSALVIITGVLGGVLTLLSPWSKERSESQAGGIGLVPQKILDHLGFIQEYVFNWRIVIPILIACLLYVVFSKLKKRLLPIILVTSLSMILLPLIVVAALLGYTGSIEPTGLGSYRVLHAVSVFIVLGLAGVFFSAVSVLNIKRAPLLLAIIISLTAATAVVLGFASLSKVTQAVYTKKSIMEYRKALIENDLAHNRNPIRIMPAPILLPNSQPYDIPFAGPERQIWINNWIKAYYNIPQDKDIQILSDADGYCTNFSSSDTYAKRNCAESVLH